jgi:hypothetical protein
MSHCPFCKKKIAMSKAFCSRGCKEQYFHKLQIQMNPKFVRANCFRSNDNELHKEIEKLAIRNNWDPSLVKDAFIEKAKELGYAFNYAVDFPKKIYGEEYYKYTKV